MHVESLSAPSLGALDLTEALLPLDVMDIGLLLDAETKVLSHLLLGDESILREAPVADGPHT